jgi:hypothetical protein
MRHSLVFYFLLVQSLNLYAQNGIIRGRVFNKLNNDPVPFASILVQQTLTGTAADIDGKYEIKGLMPGTYNLEVSFVGFEKQIVYEVMVSEARPAIVDIFMVEFSQRLDEVKITSSSGFYKPDESPVSLKTISSTEIKRAPGGNRDISRVVRSLPGVASTPSFRNDIIIRGGAPGENTFYLDGIQIPVINHFQTQGSSGGPVGIINVDLLNEVDFYSGAFPANRNNTLSSVFDFRLKDGRTDKWIANGVVGASDLGLTFEGPVSENSSLVFSVRRSYLQFLFNVLNLPFLPTYNDAQFKYKHKLNDKSQLTILGIGAYDDFRLNLNAPEKIDDEAERESAEYILNYLPVTKQWNYTIGAKYERFRKNGSSSVILSHNQLNNSAVKYRDNDERDENNLIQDYQSRESEIRLRIEDFSVVNDWRLSYGIIYTHSTYNTSDFSRIVSSQGIVERDFNSQLSLNQWGGFVQASKTIWNERAVISGGVRTDASDYSAAMNNMIDQISPRISFSYSLSDNLSLNANAGIYYQLPPFTVLGYRNTVSGELENKDNGIKYIRSNHLVGGVEYRLPFNARITLESFYKKYADYPFLTEDQVALANLGADFGVLGNAPASPDAAGRSYGLEFLYQQKLYKGFYGLLAYTLVRSEFTDKNGNFIPSSWDNRNLVSFTGGKQLKRNWEIASRWLYSGGNPFTPFNVNETVRAVNWDIRGFGIPDYTLLNTQRTGAYHQLDLRIDKKYFFPRWSINFFLDIQNIYGFAVKLQSNIDVVRDTQGQPLPNPINPDFYIPRFIQSTSGTILPTIGLIIEL